ncbi:MAG TPA: multidrug efflux RND transporter permease subunit [Bryobacteraceae bacterium]|nr:multidrug efflux RND transporter permease subunit [Bryobacteraceae bacterium]
MSKFFINRPIVAIVIALITVIVGGVVIVGLPVAQFPAIAPPEIQVYATYVGADAQTIEQSVATPIEQQMSGVDNMNYMYSLNATANGQMRMTVDFDVATDPNTDLILAQSRETLAASQLPTDVTNYGITVQKSVLAPLLLIALSSPGNTHDSRFLANYSYINLNDQLTRVKGVGSVQVFGAGQYAMRLWVRPDQLAKLQITVPEIVSAIQKQNTVNPAGQVGGEPVPQGQEFTYAVRAQGRLTSPEEFEQIVVRETPESGIVRVGDVARVELGTQDYSIVGRLNGKPSAVIAVYQLPGSNAVETAQGIKKLMAEAKKRFPEDVDYVIPIDTTLAVNEGVREIVVTLAIAIVLVIAVVYLFLQSWRATLIPLLAVPVSLVGAFLFFPVFGFTINTLSLFGLVLAIGLVVDDAIVVVEAVERHIENGLAPKEAAVKAMGEITGPVVGIALVLSAVFVPTAFIPGITGRLYQQFAVTIAVSVILSAFNALSLSPALAALLLKPRGKQTGLLARFFGWFNRVFSRGTNAYVRVSGILLRRGAVALVMLGGLGVLGLFIGGRLPTSFVPDEDQGYFFLNVQLPNSASLQRTEAVMAKINKILLDTPGVENSVSVTGFSLLSFVRTSYNGFIWVSMKDWADRRKTSEQFQAIKARLNQQLRKMPESVAFAFSPPAIPGVGASGGFTFILEDRSGGDVKFLASNVARFIAAARKRPEIANLSTTFLPSVPQQYVQVDRDKVIKQGVDINDVYRTIQTFMGGLFVNYFNRFGRQWQVYVEAEGNYRTKSENVGLFYVRNASGQMVPLSSLVRFEWRDGPEFTMRFNEYRSAQLNGAAAPGYSSDQATHALEEVFAQTMPREMGFDYSGISFQEKKAAEGVSPAAIFGFSLLFVFLILAALYESWTLPISVLLSTPVAVFGAFVVLWLRRTLLGLVAPAFMVQIENDVYSQIGLVMLIGLAAKNAILIVEFARDEFEKGRPLADAALEGARLRLRPILMTSFAFILGCVPLWTASGAGAVSRQIMGTTVIGGMLALCVIGVFLIPGFFYMVERLSGAMARGTPRVLPERPLSEAGD